MLGKKKPNDSNFCKHKPAKYDFTVVCCVSSQHLQDIRWCHTPHFLISSHPSVSWFVSYLFWADEQGDRDLSPGIRHLSAKVNSRAPHSCFVPGALIMAPFIQAAAAGQKCEDAAPLSNSVPFVSVFQHFHEMCAIFLVLKHLYGLLTDVSCWSWSSHRVTPLSCCFSDTVLCPASGQMKVSWIWTLILCVLVDLSMWRLSVVSFIWIMTFSFFSFAFKYLTVVPPDPRSAVLLPHLYSRFHFYHPSPDRSESLLPFRFHSLFCYPSPSCSPPLSG